MNTVLFLALTSLPGADPATPSGGTCACKATKNITSVTPVAAKPEKQPLFHRLGGLFGRKRQKNEPPAANSQQYNVNAYNNFRPETVILPEPITTTVPYNQGATLLPNAPAPLPPTQAPLLLPAGPAQLPRTTVPTTAEPPLN